MGPAPKLVDVEAAVVGDVDGDDVAGEQAQLTAVGPWDGEHGVAALVVEAGGSLI
jgi:hypothetical protein